MARKILISVPGNEAPEGGSADVLVAPDGIEIRAAHWPARAPDTARGTVVVFNGRTEFIEKYYEVIEELLERNFAVATLDWRGQGLSSRQLTNRLKGFVGDYSQYVMDADLLMEKAVKPSLPEPYYLLAHSMGGNIALRYLGERPGVFKKSVLCAPMTGIAASMPTWMMRIIAEGFDWLGFGASFALGQGKDDPLDSTFEANTVTSDKDRFERAFALVKHDNDLLLGGVTWHWLTQSMRSIDIVTSKTFLKQITCPMLILTATDEKFVTPESHTLVAKRHHDTKQVPFEGARHEILQERDEFRTAFWREFDAFISQ